MSHVTLCFARDCPTVLTRALVAAGYASSRSSARQLDLPREAGREGGIVLFDGVPQSLRPQPHLLARVQQLRAADPTLALIAVLDVRFAGARSLRPITEALLAAGADDVLTCWGNEAELAGRLRRAVGRRAAVGGMPRMLATTDAGHIVGERFPRPGALPGEAMNPAMIDVRLPAAAEVVDSMVSGRSASGAKIGAAPALSLPEGAVRTIAPAVEPKPAPVLAQRTAREALQRPQIDPQRRELTGPRGRVPLTAKESIVMRMLIEAPGVVLRQQLAEAVWTQGWVGTPKAIDMHVSNLRKKLRQVGGAGWQITAVRGTGFILEVGAKAA